MSYLIGVWTYTNPSGGVIIQNLMEYKTTTIERSNGSYEVRREKTPHAISVQCRMSNMNIHTDKPIVLDGEEFWLKKGEFVVQDIPENRRELKNLVQRGFIRMKDWSLQEQFLGENIGDQVKKIDVDNSEDVKIVSPQRSEQKKEEARKKREEALAKVKSKIKVDLVDSEDKQNNESKQEDEESNGEEKIE